MDPDEGIERFIADVLRLEREVASDASQADLRAQYRRRCRHFDGPPPAGVSARDEVIPGDPPVPVRIHRPAASGTLPAVVYFHGGGWVVGDLESHQAITEGIAGEAGLAVVAVDYRLAPEHPYPAALQDALAVVRYLSRAGSVWGVDGTRLAVAGDSAGGNLAAAVALAAREEGGPTLRGQALFYPCLDPDLNRPSCRGNAEGPLLTVADMAGYWAAYLGGAKTTGDPLAAPLKAATLRGLPPALVATAGRDPLCDDGRAYAARLVEGGVPVVYREAPRLVHGYLRARFLSPDAAAEFAAACAWLRTVVA